MDPQQQPPRLRSQAPRASYISDFVSARPGAGEPRPSAPTPPASASSSLAVGPAPLSSASASAAPSTPTTPTTPSPTPHHTSFATADPPPVAPRSSDIVSKSKQGFRDVVSIFGVLVSALLLAFCLITFVFQSYQVDGPSMQTTLQNADHLIVWKVPRTIAKITHHPYIPNRGDVVIFNEPSGPELGEGKQLIKRVMALPGERVVVKDGFLTVFNTEHPDGFSPDKTLPYGKVIVTTPGNIDITLKANQVYVCGDNRTNSLDSRVFGPISADQLVGKLVMRVLPLNTVKKF